MSKRIVFTVENGQVTLETTGFTGPACEAATKAFEEALGGKITEKKRTADYHRSAPVQLKQGQQ